MLLYCQVRCICCIHTCLRPFPVLRKAALSQDQQFPTTTRPSTMFQLCSMRQLMVGGLQSKSRAANLRALYFRSLTCGRNGGS